MLDFIINPVSGGNNGKKSKKTVAALQQYLNGKQIPFSLHYTTCKGSATTLCSDLIDNGATDIIVVGGDGTLHEVLNGFHDFEKCNLGLIPSGTGNDFARAINLPLSVEKNLDIITTQKPKYTDFMQMPTVRGMNIIGTGLDVEVLKRYSALKKKTKWGYTKCLIKTLFNFEYSNFTATLDGKSKKYRSVIACIANGSDYGGGIPICPVANPCDNKLDFVAIKEVKGLKLIFAFLKLKAGKILSLKQAEHFVAEKIGISIDKNYTVNVDGELYDNIPFEISVVKNTLKMYR